MHTMQQNMENDRNNPPVGNIPGHYMRNTVQYFPTSSETRFDIHGHNAYHDINKLIAPTEYRRPSSAPLTPVEPKKIGRHFRRSNSVEELSPDALHDGDPRRDNGLSRYQFPTGASVRTCGAGVLNIPDPNRNRSTSHFAAMDTSIMSHSRPASFDPRHEYEMNRTKADRIGTNDLKEINHRPYMDSHPYSNIKKNLAERFIMSESSERTFFNPSSSSLTSSTYHPAVSRSSENYFTWSQYPPRTETSGMSRGPYNGPHDTMVTRPHHNEQLPGRTNHVDSHSLPARHNEAKSKKEEEDARMQAMNTYFEMMANVQQPGSTPEGLFIRSREVIIQKGNLNKLSSSTFNSNSNHPITSQHPHPHEKNATRHPHEQNVTQHPHDKSLTRHPHEQSLTQHPHEQSLTQRPHEQSLTRHPHEQSLTRRPHEQSLPRRPHEQALPQHPHEQSTIQHPSLNNHKTAPPHSHQPLQSSTLQQHHLHNKDVTMQRGTPPHPCMEGTAKSSHNIHGVTTHPTQNAPWSTVGPADIREKEQNVNYYRTAPTNSMDCGCTYAKNDMAECKGRNQHFKPSETNHTDHSRYIKTGESDHADHSRFIMRSTEAQYEVGNPYEGTQYRVADKVHPPELISYQEKPHHSGEYTITTPSRPSEMVAPPILKIETPKIDAANSPSSHKKRPRPEPLVIPCTVNNKALLSTPCSMGMSVMNLQHQSVYTPPPMLSPRSIFFNPPLSIPRVYPPVATGYVVQTPRRVSLSTVIKLETPCSGGSIPSAEKTVEVPEPKINVGPRFQAVVPNLYEKCEAQKDIHRAGLMWSPLKDEKRKDEDVLQYLEMACSLALYGGSTNKEYALHILQRTRGNVKEAIRLLLSRRHILRADDPNADYHYSGSVRWNAKERLAFRTAFHTKGKVFSAIQKEIGSKSVASCVEFYYLWKARHPESFRMRTRTAVEVESEQDEEEVPPTPTAAVAPLSTLREPVFECDYPSCNARFISRQALNGHIRVHGGSQTKTPDARRPPKEKGSNLISPKTGQVGSTMDSPPKRKKTTPGVPTQASDGTPLQFQCKVCGRVFNKVKSRSAHMKTHVKRDENNKPIKTPKTKVQVEIKPLQQPLDNLIHSLNDDNNNPAFESSKPSPAFDHVIDSTKQPFNFSIDNTDPRFALFGDTKPPFGLSLGNAIQPHVSTINTHAPMDVKQGPLDVKVELTTPPSELPAEHAKSIESSNDTHAPPFDKIVS